MTAKIKLTVGNKVFLPGETITKNINAQDKAFLLREGYIEEERKASGKSVKKEEVPAENA